MKKFLIIGALVPVIAAVFAFTFQTNPLNTVNYLHQPLLAVVGTDSFNCDPSESKHHGRVHNRFNTLHMKEKGPENIIVHFKSRKFTDQKGRASNDHVHFDILLKDGKVGPREDTHLTLTWKDKKYHVKGSMCTFNITKIEKDEKHHQFIFSADFNARLETGGSDTSTIAFKGKIVDEVVKLKGHHIAAANTTTPGK